MSNFILLDFLAVDNYQMPFWKECECFSSTPPRATAILDVGPPARAVMYRNSLLRSERDLGKVRASDSVVLGRGDRVMDGCTAGPDGDFLDERPDERLGLRQPALPEEGVHLFVFSVCDTPLHLGNTRGSIGPAALCAASPYVASRRTVSGVCLAFCLAPCVGLSSVRDSLCDADPIDAGPVGALCSHGDVVLSGAGRLPIGDEDFLPCSAGAGGTADCVPVQLVDPQDLELGGLEPFRQAVLGPEPDGVLITLLEVCCEPVLVGG